MPAKPRKLPRLSSDCGAAPLEDKTVETGSGSSRRQSGPSLRSLCIAMNAAIAFLQFASILRVGCLRSRIERHAA